MNIISSLATYQHLSLDKTYGERDASSIKYFIPHHMAGVMTAINGADYFYGNGLKNSVNYCVGYLGGISCNVPENYGPWTSSWWRVDTQAITVEVSNSSRTDSDWPVSDAAIKDLIRLMVDVFMRYPSLGGKAIYDPADEAIVVASRAKDVEPQCRGNILLHNWTDPQRKNCPGPYMTRNMAAICAEVNKILDAAKTKVDKFIEALEELGDGRYHYYDGKAMGIGCSEYTRLALVKAGIIKEGETFHAASGNVGVLADTTRFQKLPWNQNSLRRGDILWSNMHHVCTWAGDSLGSVYEAAPDAPGTNHPLATCGTGVGLHLRHGTYNCGTGGNSWTCIYRIIENMNRTLFEEAQYMIDNNINGTNRRSQARADGFDPDDVQGKIDMILSKDPFVNIEVLVKIMPVLQKGSEGVSVYVLQAFLKNMGYYGGELDGKFGNLTETALKQLQKNLNKVYGSRFAVDGICGPVIWSRLLLGK